MLTFRRRCNRDPPGSGRVTPSFASARPLCAVTGQDPHEDAQMSDESEAATHPGTRACTEERPR